MLLLPSVFAALAVAVLGGPKRGKKKQWNKGKDDWVNKSRSHAQSWHDGGGGGGGSHWQSGGGAGGGEDRPANTWGNPKGKGGGKDGGKGGGKGKRTRDRRGWKMHGLKPADLWPMFLAAAEARGETEEFATSEWDRRVALRNDEIRAHSNLFASDYMVQPDQDGNPARFPVCAVCTWAGEHLAHQCKTTEPGYVPNSKRRAGGGKGGW